MTGQPVRPRTVWRRVDGIVLLDKPLGLTSNRALQIVRRLYRAEKAGHTGSLDPLASGILPLCFGEATKVAGFLLDADKRYVATLALGSQTNTGDREGVTVNTMPVPPLTESAVDAVLSRFVGDTVQIPPMYSALKKDGEALYTLARRGEVVEREPRPVHISALTRLSCTVDSLTFEVACSKGTYVRTLGEDIAAALGTVGHLSALRRTGVGAGFQGRAVHTLEALDAISGDESALEALLLAPDEALVDWPVLSLPSAEAARFCHGQALPVSAPVGRTRVYEVPSGRFLGLAEVSAGQLVPKRLFN
jgi:tRNA pseudouridine55 synthase